MPLLAGIFGCVASASRFLPNRGVLCRLREKPSDHHQPKEGHLSLLANLTSAAVKAPNVSASLGEFCEFGELFSVDQEKISQPISYPGLTVYPLGRFTACLRLTTGITKWMSCGW